MKKELSTEGVVQIPLEKYEWDDIWFDHATDNTLKRVIVFGDSITVNFRFALIEQLDGEFHVDNYGTSKAADNPFLLANMEMILAQKKHDIIHFRTGHGSHQSAYEYECNTERLVHHLLNSYPEKKLILSLKPYREKDAEHVLERNEAIIRIAEKYKLPIDDLYSLTANRSDLLVSDGIHLNDLGKQVVAKHVAKTIRAVDKDL